MYSRCLEFMAMHGRKLFMGTSVMAPVAFLGSTAVSGDMECVDLPHYHWEFEEWNKSFDTAALRRGWQVYKEVCASCHSMNFLCYRHLVGVTHTNNQAKFEANQAMIEDGPDEAGEMFLRPGVLTDTVPPPYKNDNAARAANNGALPPDLSLIAGARHGGVNYVFSLLLGYDDEIPPGVDVGETQYFNRVFEGGAIGMPPPLNDGAVEYPDGTPATITQMSRDVSEFFMWAYWRNMDRSKQVGMIMALYAAFGAGFFYWIRRYMIAHLVTQRITYRMRPNYAMKV